jgi:6-phosphogluconolactonase
MFTFSMNLARTVLVATIAGLLMWRPSAKAAIGESVYIGTYTGLKSQGIYYCQFDEKMGALTKPELVIATKNPSFLAIHPNHKFLYTVNEVSDFAGNRTGAASAFTIESSSGKLKLLNQCRTGDGPCHLSIDKTGRQVLVANYGGGSVEVLSIKPDGHLAESENIDSARGKSQTPVTFIQNHGSSVNPQRQAGPHAHFILPDPRNHFALVCDLGLDKIFAYPFDSKVGTLDAKNAVSLSMPPGAGPRHLAFHPSGKYAYVISEMASTLTACKYNSRSGKLEVIGARSTLPDDFKGQSTCAEVQVHPSGRFVYASNRGDDSIAVFAIDNRNGGLKFVEREFTRGKTPRHFTLSPSGKWLLCGNQESNNISIFRVAPESGQLTFNGNSAEVGAPVCMVFAD